MSNSPPTAVSPAPAGAEIDGPEVRRRRKLAGKSVTDLAESCGITFQYLSMIERGDRRTVSPAVFGRICNALGLDETERVALLKAGS
jgi:transcriptional regulator with XRE-family HTH domain